VSRIISVTGTRLPAKHGSQTQLLPLTESNTYRLCFKSTPRRPRRHGRAGALARDAAAGHLRGNEMPGLQLLVQRLARKRLARDRDPPVTHAIYLLKVN